MTNKAWDRQKRELQAYNTFYSAITGRASDRSFSSEGYFLRGSRTEISSSANGNPEPDFVLYDGENLLLVEVKSGRHIEEDHVQQMRKSADLSIEDAQEYLQSTDVESETGYDGSISNIEPCIVYSGLDEDYLQEWRGESDEFTENLEDLESIAPILGQSRGGQLRILSGEFSDQEIQNWLDDGIELPHNPQKQYYLTDGLEPESIAVAVCQEWGERAVKGADGVEVSVQDVREKFQYRPPEIADVAEVFQVLEHLDICESGAGDREYVFRTKHMKNIVRIEEYMREKTWDEYQQEISKGSTPEGQASMDEFVE